MSYQREFEKRLKIGVIGVGSHCYRNILPAMNYLPVEIKAICDLNIDAAKITAAQYGNCAYYQHTGEMYEKECLDAVFISVSPKIHAKLSCEAFDAGVSVWVEKPVAMRVSEVQEMIERRKENICVVGLKKAFTPAAEKAIEICNSPKYGNLRSILAVYPMSIPKNGKEVLENETICDWLANGVHPLAFLMAVGGTVAAITVHNKEDGYGTVVLEFKNGVIGNLHMASGPQPLEYFSLFGDKWHLDIHNGSRIVLHRGIPFKYKYTTNYAPAGDESGAVVWEPQNCLATLENKALFTQGFYNGMKYFCDCVLEGKKSQKGALEFALEMMKVYEAGLISNGKTIFIK